MKKLDKEKIKENIKEKINGIKEYAVMHKVACISAVGVLAAVIVTVVIVAAVIGSHSSADTVAGVETQDETKETISAMTLADNTTDESTEETEEAETEETAEEADSSMEFEYDGRKIVISTDKPVELIPEEELEKKVEQDTSTTVIGAGVDVDDPGTGAVKEPEKNNYDIIIDNNEKKEVYAGEKYLPLAGVKAGELDNASASNVGFTITDEVGNVVKSMTSDEVKNYNGNPEDITVVFDKPGTYNIHYEFTAPGVNITEAVHGIDVSHWQNDINWGAVAADGYKFAMIKVAGRSIADSGNLYEDDYFRKNIEEATANGIQVGVYFFSQALNVQEAYEEASYILNLIKGYNITYPVAFDWETSGGYRTSGRLNAEELTSICEAFCDTVKSHGYQPMIYMSKSDWVNRVYTNRLASKYNVWLAWYFYKYYNVDGNSRYEKDYYEDGDELPDLDFPYNIWQYTSTGGVSGVPGNCDKNVAFATTYKPGDTITKNISVSVLKKEEETTKAPDNTTQPTTSAGSNKGNDKEKESSTEAASKDTQVKSDKETTAATTANN